MNTSEKKYLIDYDELMVEWDWNKNNELGLDPKNIAHMSGKSAWWKCNKGHEWRAIINKRTSRNQGCPYCYGRLPIVGKTDLSTTNPEIALEWHPTKNGALTPKDVSHGSDKKVWWQCNQGHEWEATIGSRTRGCNCPYCSGQKVWAGFNDLATTNPQLALEWNYEKNGDLTPSQIAEKSNKKVWWICDQGHEWMATLDNRSAGKGCPVCAKEMQTSFPEQAILFYFKKVTTAENRNTDFGKEIDIYLPEYKIGIEYNGIYYHENNKSKDQEKVSFLRTKGVRVISVNEGNTNHVIGDCIEYEYININKGSLDWVINTIFNMLNINYLPVDVYSHQVEIWNQYIISKKENSLAKKYPNIASEWHPTKNGKLTPENVIAHSSKNVWWKCKYCEHEWQTSIAHRTSNNSSCPKCAAKNRNINRCKPIYCVEMNIVFISKSDAEKQMDVNNISAHLSGRLQSAGKHPITNEKLHWYYVYDQLQKDGSVVSGAITLGFITEKEALKMLEEQKGEEQYGELVRCVI